MYGDLKIAVVIPAYNEQDRIADVIRNLPSLVDHIIVVDDHSSDNTAAAAKAVTDPRLTVIRLDHNQGVGGATLAGWDRAVELGAEVLVKMDGDGQMDPNGLPTILDPVRTGAADYTKGNRFLHARELVRMPLSRRIGNIGLSFMAKLASGYWNMFDPNNGYLAIHASVYKMLDRRRLHPRFFFENSLLLELGLQRAVVRDVYMPSRYNDKVSHLSEAKAFLQFPPMLFKGVIRRIVIQYFVRDFAAVSLFLVSGNFLTAFGVLWGAWHWYLSAVAGVVTPTGTVMIAVLPLILGLQILLQAFVLDIQNVPTTTVGSKHSFRERIG
jgi:glycosyltransferase involved in cell wall biosynthesis